MRLPHHRAVSLLAAFVASFAGAGVAGQAQEHAAMTLAVDASQAPQKIYHVKVTMPAAPGNFTFVYPEWIPGFHSPSGPLPGVVGIRVSANGTPVAWRRDLVDFYAIHTIVPSAATSLEVNFDLVDAPPVIGEEQPRDTANLLILQWSSLLLYPQGALADSLEVDTTVTLPQGWQFATALPVKTRNGATTSFSRVSLTTLVDSPLLAGRYFRVVNLSSQPAAELDIAADSAAALAIPDSIETGMKHLVAEGPAIYGSRHWRNYHFLLALTDSFSYNGIEHHESSDNRAGEQYLTDPDDFRVGADLLPHEFSHSWNGKYRRPADLLTPDFQVPEKTDLLWVYEGLNQYVGEVLAARSRLYDYDEQRDALAMSAATMDAEGGRRWRPLRDVADEAPILYVAPPQWYALRRSADDFYTEGALIWLEADTIIRQRSGGKRSLDDFLQLWASGGSTTPSVKTYVLADLVATLNAVEPFDWGAFFDHRVNEVQPNAPLLGIENGGWRLVYSATPSARWKANEAQAKIVDLSLSAGIVVSNDTDDAGKNGQITDVYPGSPAAKAGIAPGMKLLAVNGRKWSDDTLHAALSAAQTSHQPLQLLVANGDFYSTASVEVYTGNRYPHLERIADKPDVLKQIYAPRTFSPKV